MGLTRIALKRPVSTLLVVLAIFVFGFSSLMGLRLELMPDMDMPIQMVLTVYPGADPESVEALVSSEIEGDVASLSGVDTVYSYSMENYSMVLLQYDYDTDINDAYIDLRAALDAADLPDDAQEPTVIQMDVNSMASIMYSISLTDGSDALAYVNDELVPELESVGTVASVDVTGGRENYIRVLLDEEALSQYGLSMSTVASYIAANDFTVPLGSLEQGSQSISAISTVDVETVQALKEVPLYTSSGQLIQLSDVAEVSWEEEAADSISRFNGEETVTVSVTKNQTASTLGMISDVEDIMEEMSEENENLVYETSYDASELIIESISSVASTLVIGVILSMLILFLFFGDIRASVIVGFSMPISLMVTIILMSVLGFSLNIITMGGLVIAIGMMVDNSIVMIDGCFRGRVQTEDLTEAALFASKSVAGSIFAGTLTTVVIYIPICLQSGMAGQMLGQLGYTIIFSLSASLISALTLVPLFYRMFKPREHKELKINSALEAVKKKYDPMVRCLLRHKGLTIAVSVLALVGAFALAAFGLDMELMPSTDEGTVSIEATLRPGTKVEDVDEQIAEIEAMVAA
ncbi:MAG: efflux RND transporter permease subunit, partial [Lachnospiraceae bacterium]|nr:efflux RND transporter permease subunit [Lachnospiraceae bacterium]